MSPGSCPGFVDTTEEAMMPLKGVQMEGGESRRFSDEFKARTVELIESSGRS